MGTGGSINALFSYLCITQEDLFLRWSYGVLLVQGKDFQMHIILRTKTNNVIATAGNVPGWQLSYINYHVKVYSMANVA